MFPEAVFFSRCWPERNMNLFSTIGGQVLFELRWLLFLLVLCVANTLVCMGDGAPNIAVGSFGHFRSYA